MLLRLNLVSACVAAECVGQDTDGVALTGAAPFDSTPSLAVVVRMGCSKPVVSAQAVSVTADLRIHTV